MTPAPNLLHKKAKPIEPASFLHSDIGYIFITGAGLLILWMIFIIALFNLNHPDWIHLFTMGVTQIMGGRAASIAIGTQHDIHPFIITMAVTLVDTIVVFILYPLFAYSYEHLFEMRFFQKHMKPLFDSVQRNVSRFRKYKIISVFLFVWFPFSMTGVIIGSLLGYLLRMKPWETMFTVVGGTFAAIVSWVFIYDLLYGWVEKINKDIPLYITFAIIFSLILYRIISRKKGHKHD